MKRAARGGAGGKEAGRLLQSSLPNPRCPRRRQSKILLLPVELRSFAAPSSNKPNIAGRSSSVSSTRPDFTTRPPSSMSCRVRSRRFTTHARVSSRARRATNRWPAAAARLSAVCDLRRRASSAPPRPLKEGDASLAPRLLHRRLRFRRGEQGAGERLDRQRVRTGRDCKLAELPKLLLLEQFGSFANCL